MAKQSTNHLSISGSAFADLLSFTFRSSFELFSALLNTINVAQSKKKRILEGYMVHSRKYGVAGFVSRSRPFRSCKSNYASVVHISIPQFLSASLETLPLILSALCTRLRCTSLFLCLVFQAQDRDEITPEKKVHLVPN